MIQTIQAQQIQQSDITAIIDVRTRDEFIQEHIPGSVNIPLDELEQATTQLQSMPRVIVSCRSGNRAGQACASLEHLGLQNLLLLEGGLMGWKAAKRETVSLKKGYSIMQQVQIIVGLMILTGVFIKPLWFLTLIAGLGMLTAGLTNTCMMAVFLSKMPWNRTSVSQCKI